MIPVTGHESGGIGSLSASLVRLSSAADVKDRRLPSSVRFCRCVYLCARGLLGCGCVGNRALNNSTRVTSWCKLPCLGYSYKSMYATL